MGTKLREVLMGRLDELRYEPTAKRVTALHQGTLIARTTSARIVWEPRRVVPVYAVPSADLVAEVVPAAAVAPDAGTGLTYPMVSDRPVLDPSIPFTVHSAPGTALDVVTGSGVLPAAAFRPRSTCPAATTSPGPTASRSWTPSPCSTGSPSSTSGSTSPWTARRCPDRRLPGPGSPPVLSSTRGTNGTFSTAHRDAATEAAV